MSEPIYLTTLVIVFGTIIFAVRYLALFKQAQAKVAMEENYRKVAEKAATAQAETAATLAAIKVTLDDMRSRVGAIEKVLKEVE